MASHANTKDFLRTARDRWKRADDADSKQAEREKDDLAFYAGDQWPADVRNARMGLGPTQGANPMPAVPSRPTLVINKVREPVRQIQNQERQADIGVEIVPADDFGDLGVTPDDTEITLREGLVRRIQRESIASDARTWAFARASIAGRGYYLVMTRYLPGKTFDQEVYIERIYNQAGVLLDPSHHQPDGSDAEWGFIGTWVPYERYKAEYPKAADERGRKVQDYTDSDFTRGVEEYPGWYDGEAQEGTEGNDTRAVRVVDYWYVERTQREIVMFTNEGQAQTPDQLQTFTFYEDELVETTTLPEGFTEKARRTVIEKSICYAKIGGGCCILDETEWAGPDMPIIKVIGEELQPYDSDRRCEGMVRSARDAQMGENYMISKFVETVGLSPIPRDRLDPDAISGFEDWWNAANTRTLPYLPYRSRNDNGQEFAPPIPSNGDPNILPIAQGIQFFNEFIQSTTAMSDPALGKTDPSVKSARHARYLIEESQQANSNLLDNLARSIRYEGQVINNLLYPIYGAKPGRLVRTMTGEGEAEMMLIADPQQMQVQQQQQARAKQVAKLTKDAHFNVIVKVTRAFNSRREQETTQLGELISAEPQFMGWFGDLYFANSDVPNRKQLGERARAMLAPPIQQMLAAKEGGQNVPPEIQAQMAQMQQQLQEAGKLLQMANQEIQNQTAKARLESQTKLQITTMEAQRDQALETLRLQGELEKARMDNAAKIHVAEIAAKTKGVIQAQEMEHEAIALAHTQQHEAEQASLDRENLARQQQAQQAGEERRMAHDAAMGDSERDHASREAERDRVVTVGENEQNRRASAQGDGAGE